MTEHGSNKTGPLRDDEAKKQLQGELSADRPTRAEEEREPQPPGEDQPGTDRDPEGELVGGTPPGMGPDDVALRAELARHLGRGLYPADRASVLATLRENNAPDRLLAMAADLPQGARFRNVQDIANALGLGTETRRT